MKLSPFYAIPKALILKILGKAIFPKNRIGKVIKLDDGKEFTIFREVQMKHGKNRPEIPQGVFQVWFQTKAEIEDTIRLSNITLFFFMGLPGFRSKLWLVNRETGEFGGIYEWDSVNDADNYDKSYAMKLSKRRSIPGKFRTVFFSQSDERARVHRPNLS